jgi:polysaccharide biosynthesis protein PslL
MSSRIGYFDVARGIGILLVVLGHNDLGALSPFLQRLIYSFHIPLFFFLSGYFTDPSLPFRDFFTKRFHAVLKPYLFTIFLIYFASVSFEKMGFQTAIGRILKALYGSINYIDWGQLWFLPHLFVVSLYAYIFISVASRFRSRALRWGLLLGTLVAAFVLLRAFYPFSISIFNRQYEVYGLPFSLDLILLSGFFFILGGELKNVVHERTFDNWLILVGAVLGVIVLSYLFPYRVDIAVRVYESPVVNTLEAILGIFLVMGLARQIDVHSAALASLFKYLGSISLIILIFHVPIQAFWSQKVMAVTNHLPLSIFVGFLMGVLGPVLIHEIFIRFNPVASYWFGRKAEPVTRQEIPIKEERTLSKTPGAPAVESKEH